MKTKDCLVAPLSRKPNWYIVIVIFGKHGKYFFRIDAGDKTKVEERCDFGPGNGQWVETTLSWMDLAEMCGGVHESGLKGKVIHHCMRFLK